MKWRFDQEFLACDQLSKSPRSRIKDRFELPRMLPFRLHQLDMANAKRLRQFVERDHGWVALSSFQAAQVLLAKA